MWYSGKAHSPGGNVQAVSAPTGLPLWVPRRRTRLGARPGCRRPRPRPTRVVLGSGTSGPADPGRARLRRCRDRHTHPDQATRRWPSPRPQGNRTYNALLRGLRSLCERGFAVLVGPLARPASHFTCSPERIGTVVEAALVLTHFEYRRVSRKLVRSLHWGIGIGGSCSKTTGNASSARWKGPGRQTNSSTGTAGVMSGTAVHN